MTIDKVFSDGESQVSYTYPSQMCECEYVHKGIIKFVNGKLSYCLDMCITLEMANKEIKELEERK